MMKFTIYFPPETSSLLDWAKKTYGTNLSEIIRNFLLQRKEETEKQHTITAAKPESKTLQENSDETKNTEKLETAKSQLNPEVEASVKTAFADITNDNTFIADVGRAFAANATRLRYEQLRLKHPGCDAQIRQAIKHDHAELARLSGLND